MEDVSKSFLEQAKKKMKRMKKTQTQLADEIGICYSTVNKTFNFNRTLEFSLAIKIANNLGLSIDKYFQTNQLNYLNIDNLDEIADEMEKLINKLRSTRY